MTPNDKPIPEHQFFVHNKHKTLFNTPDHLIESAIVKATGSTIKNKEKIVKGDVNEVYGIETVSGEKLIVRISRRKYPKFEAEKWAIEKCEKLGIPVPRVLLIDSAEIEGELLTFCVESRLPGVPLDELRKSISASVYSDLIENAGKILSIINSIEINGFGALDKNGNGKYATAKEVLLYKYAVDEEKLLAAAEVAKLNPALVKKGLEILKKEADNYPPITSHLLHNDFGAKHILVENNKITGIIDFEIVQGGDPAWEFARWDFFYTGGLEELKKGYQNQELFSGDFERRFQVWKLYSGLTNTRHCVEEGNQYGIKNAVKQLTSAVEYFS